MDTKEPVKGFYFAKINMGASYVSDTVSRFLKQLHDEEPGYDAISTQSVFRSR